MYAIVAISASGMHQHSDSLADNTCHTYTDITCHYIFSFAALSAVSLVVVEVEYLINEEWPGNIVLLTYIHTYTHTYSTYIFT